MYHIEENMETVSVFKDGVLQIRLYTYKEAFLFIINQSINPLNLNKRLDFVWGKSGRDAFNDRIKQHEFYAKHI